MTAEGPLQIPTAVMMLMKQRTPKRMIHLLRSGAMADFPREVEVMSW